MTELEFQDHLQKSIRRPDQFLLRIFRFGMEAMRISDSDWIKQRLRTIPKERHDEFAPMFRMMDRAVRQPTGWRKKIWANLLSNVFKPLRRRGVPKDPVFEAGYLLGLLVNVAKTMKSEAPRIIESEEAALLFGNQIDPQELTDQLDFGPLQEYALSTHSRLMGVANLPESKRFQAGFSRGCDDFFRDDFSFKRQRKSTLVYLNLLLLDKEVRRLKSVEEMFDFLTHAMAEDFDYDLDSFRVLCSRIGLAGNKYGRGSKKV